MHVCLYTVRNARDLLEVHHKTIAHEELQLNTKTYNLMVLAIKFILKRYLIEFIKLTLRGQAREE